MFQRLRTRITLLSVVLLVVLYSITSIAVYAIVRSRIVHDIDIELQQAYEVIQSSGRLGSISQVGVYAIVSNGANVEVDTIPSQYASEIKKAIDTKTTDRQFTNLYVANHHFRILYQPLPTFNDQAQPYIATIVEDTLDVEFLKRLKQVILLVGLFGLAGATIVGFVLADRMLRPIRAAWRRQLEFVADASHELRTPLAVIQSNLGIVMEHTDESVMENLEWLNNAHGESRRLSKLVKDLLTLARSDSERMPIERNPLDLKALVEHVQELYETVAEMKGIELTTNAPTSVQIIGDEDRLHQLLVILIDNAVKFTDAGGRIEIGLSIQRNQAVVTVTDTGLGIAKENLERVFDRFFTVDPARSREQSNKGTGLGLAIAQWVVTAHGGKISISSPGLGQGTSVRVELPLAQH